MDVKPSWTRLEFPAGDEVEDGGPGWTPGPAVNMELLMIIMPQIKLVAWNIREGRFNIIKGIL